MVSPNQGAHTRRPFTSELRRSGAGSPATDTASHRDDVSNREVLAAIQALHKDIKRGVGAGGVSAEVHAEEHAAYEAEHAEVQRRKEETNQLRTELKALSRCINETKSEISALWARSEEEDKILAMTHELDAVVSATEGATNAILENTEKIDELAQHIRLQASDQSERDAADEIAERVMRVFEACNFQDLTGQRITKVVNTLKFIEERINSMIDIWGEEDIAEVREHAPALDRDKALLNGPQMAEEAISQDEIDKLFG